MRLIALLAISAGLAGCVTAQPKNATSLDTLTAYNIAEIDVQVPGNTNIWWGAAEQEYAATLDCHKPTAVRREDDGSGAPAQQVNTDCDYNSIIESAEAKNYLREKLSTTLELAVTETYSEALLGDKPAKLTVETKNMTIVSAGQSVLVGGSHTLIASVSLTDIETGETIVQPMSFTETAGYGAGGLFAVLVEAASEAPEIRLSNALAAKSRSWMLHETDE